MRKKNHKNKIMDIIPNQFLLDENHILTAWTELKNKSSPNAFVIELDESLAEKGTREEFEAYKKLFIQFCKVYDYLIRYELRENNTTQQLKAIFTFWPRAGPIPQQHTCSSNETLLSKDQTIVDVHTT
jgi:hypothetical protein